MMIPEYPTNEEILEENHGEFIINLDKYLGLMNVIDASLLVSPDDGLFVGDGLVPIVSAGTEMFVRGLDVPDDPLNLVQPTYPLLPVTKEDILEGRVMDDVLDSNGCILIKSETLPEINTTGRSVGIWFNLLYSAVKYHLDTRYYRSQVGMYAHPDSFLSEEYHEVDENCVPINLPIMDILDPLRTEIDDKLYTKPYNIMSCTRINLTSILIKIHGDSRLWDTKDQPLY